MNYISGVDISDKLALKRACDWGQVAHCAKNPGFAFVSTDMLACLYAASRDVGFIALQRLGYPRSRAKKQFFQCTFIMSGIPESRGQVGAGTSSYLPSILLASVILAMSVIGAV